MSNAELRRKAKYKARKKQFSAVRSRSYKRSYDAFKKLDLKNKNVYVRWILLLGNKVILKLSYLFIYIPLNCSLSFAKRKDIKQRFQQPWCLRKWVWQKAFQTIFWCRPNWQQLRVHQLPIAWESSLQGTTRTKIYFLWPKASLSIKEVVRKAHVELRMILPKHRSISFDSLTGRYKSLSYVNG